MDNIKSLRGGKSQAKNSPERKTPRCESEKQGEKGKAFYWKQGLRESTNVKQLLKHVLPLVS